MQIWGVDYSQGYDIATLQKHQVGFACRYIGFTAWSLPQDKIITYKESYDLAKAGIPVVSNFEWYNTRTSEGKDAGIADAQLAAALHQSIGGPSSRPIYFSVDYNTNGIADADYFRGVASVIGLSRTGAYGPYAAIKYLYEQGLITWMWQTYAWSNGLWYPGIHIKQYQNAVQLDDMEVDYDDAQVADFGQWTLPANPPVPVWYQYPIGVPFGNSNYDVNLGGSHDLTVLAPPNMPVTSIISGTISDISAPSWGKQVGIKLDTPINGIPYFHYLHLSATNPKLALGGRINAGDLIGWVGGANTASQYQGTTNPTGSNFLDDPSMSSQVQVGIALMNGPAYGGPGWQNFPPIDMNLDPTPTLQAARNTFNITQLQGDIPMHFETRQSLNDRTFFSTGGKPLTLYMGCDFGTAQVRVARKVANQSGVWHVNTYAVSSTNNPATTSIDTTISQVSIVVSGFSSADTIVGIDAE